MALFLFFGVLALLVAKVALLAKILWTRSCAGISGKTQCLFGIIFSARYINLATVYFTCPWGVAMLRAAFLALSFCIQLSIFLFYKDSYQSKYDKFRIELLLFPCLVLGFLANYGYSLTEVLSAFSVYLEAVAILPQIHFVGKAKRAESIVCHYIFLMSLYKLCHIADNIYRLYLLEPFDRISLAAGIVQMMFYFDFFLTSDRPVEEEQVPAIGPLQVVVSVPSSDSDAKAAKEKEANSVTLGCGDKAEITLTPTGLASEKV